MDSARCIGVRIAAIRKRRGLTQKQLGESIERSKEAVSSLERGRNMPSVETLLRLSEALGAQVPDFLAPRGGGRPESLKHALLFSELVASARTLPLADLELAAGMVGLIARQRGG